MFPRWDVDFCGPISIRENNIFDQFCKQDKDIVLYSLTDFRSLIYHLGSHSKDRQRFVDASVLISASDWSKTISRTSKNVFESFFESVPRT